MVCQKPIRGSACASSRAHTQTLKKKVCDLSHENVIQSDPFLSIHIISLDVCWSDHSIWIIDRQVKTVKVMMTISDYKYRPFKWSLSLSLTRVVLFTIFWSIERLVHWINWPLNYVTEILCVCVLVWHNTRDWDYDLNVKLHFAYGRRWQLISISDCNMPTNSMRCSATGRYPMATLNYLDLYRTAHTTKNHFVVILFARIEFQLSKNQ